MNDIFAGESTGNAGDATDPNKIITSRDVADFVHELGPQVVGRDLMHLRSHDLFLVREKGKAERLELRELNDDNRQNPRRMQVGDILANRIVELEMLPMSFYETAGSAAIEAAKESVKSVQSSTAKVGNETATDNVDFEGLAVEAGAVLQTDPGFFNKALNEVRHELGAPRYQDAERFVGRELEGMILARHGDQVHFKANNPAVNERGVVVIPREWFGESMPPSTQTKLSFSFAPTAYEGEEAKIRAVATPIARETQAPLRQPPASDRKGGSRQ